MGHAEYDTADIECRLPVPVAQETDVAYFDKPGREHVEQEPPDELGDSEGHDLFLVAVSIVLPGKRDFPLFHAENTVVRNRNAVGIPSEVLEHGLGSVEGGLGINYPLLRVEPVQENCKLVNTCELTRFIGLFEIGEKFSPEEPGENLHVEEEPPL